MLLCCCAPGEEEAANRTTRRPSDEEVLAREREREEQPFFCSFECLIDRGTSEWGLNLDCWPFGLQIVSLKAGSVERYNASAGATKQVQPHDFIVRVNEEREVRDMMTALKKETSVTLAVLHPFRDVVRVEKGPLALGLNLVFQEATGSCLQIKDISPGAVAAHNTVAEPTSRVRQLDFIERVNGVSGSATQLFQELQLANSLELSLLRLPSGPCDATDAARRRPRPRRRSPAEGEAEARGGELEPEDHLEN